MKTKISKSAILSLLLACLTSCGGFEKGTKLQIKTINGDTYSFKIKNYHFPLPNDYWTRFSLRNRSLEDLEKNVEEQSVMYERCEDDSLLFISKINGYLATFYIYYSEIIEEKEVYNLVNLTSQEPRIVLPFVFLKDKNRESYEDLRLSWQDISPNEKKSFGTEFNYAAFKSYYKLTYKESDNKVSFDDEDKAIVFKNYGVPPISLVVEDGAFSFSTL